MARHPMAGLKVFRRLPRGGRKTARFLVGFRKRSTDLVTEPHGGQSNQVAPGRGGGYSPTTLDSLLPGACGGSMNRPKKLLWHVLLVDPQSRAPLAWVGTAWGGAAARRQVQLLEAAGFGGEGFALAARLREEAQRQRAGTRRRAAGPPARMARVGTATPGAHAVDDEKKPTAKY